jgi:hypothetical protein
VVELPAPLPWPVLEGTNSTAMPVPAPATPTKPGKPPKLTLQKSEELGPQGQWGASQVLERKADVKVSGATLTARLTGTAAAYPAVICPGTALATMRLVQPFTIEPASGASPWVNVTLSARAEGYVRTLEGSHAGLRAASAAVYPAGGGPPLALALPPAATGDGGCLYYREAVSIPPTPMPAGCYVLVLDFAAEAAVSSSFHGFAEAVFSKSPAGSDRIAATNPYKDLDAKALGFAVTLKAEGIEAEPVK